MSYNILNLTKIEPFLQSGVLGSTNTTLYQTSASDGLIRITDLEFFNVHSSTTATISVRAWTNTTSNITEIYLNDFPLLPGENILVADASCPIWLGPHNAHEASTGAHGLYITTSLTGATNGVRYIISGEEFA